LDQSQRRWNRYITRLLYISVCLRTRQDTISYSFIYIIQKAEFQDIRIGNRGLESGESRGNIGLESGENSGKQGNRRLETGDWIRRKQGKQRTRISGKQGTGIRGTGDWKQGIGYY